MFRNQKNSSVLLSNICDTCPRSIAILSQFLELVGICFRHFEAKILKVDVLEQLVAGPSELGIFVQAFLQKIDLKELKKTFKKKSNLIVR